MSTSWPDTSMYSPTINTYLWINCCLCSEFKQDAKHGAEIKAVDAYCWLHSTGQLGYGVSDNADKVRHNFAKQNVLKLAHFEDVALCLFTKKLQ